MKRLWPWIAGIAAVVVAVVALNSWYQGQQDEWESRVQQVEGFAAAETARALNDSIRADSALAVADSLRGVLHGQEPEIRERVVVIREEVVPDTCDPFVAPRDSIIDDLFVQNMLWRETADAGRASALHYRSAYQGVRMANDSLTAVLADRPTRKPWWIPTLGVGPYLGVDISGRPSAGVAATLSWEVQF